MATRARWLAAATLALMCWGCSGGSAGTPDGFWDARSYEAALRADYARFTWPANLGLTQETVLANSRPASDQVYQQGMDITVMHVMNSCAWYRSWVVAHSAGDTSAQAAALAVMTNVLPGYTDSHDPDGRTFVEGAARKAALGDGTDVGSYLKANCSWTQGLGESAAPKAP